MCVCVCVCVCVCMSYRSGGGTRLGDVQSLYCVCVITSGHNQEEAAELDTNWGAAVGVEREKLLVYIRCMLYLSECVPRTHQCYIKILIKVA